MCPGAPDEEARRRDYFALAVNRSGNCSTIAPASGSAIICMWPAAAHGRVRASLVLRGLGVHDALERDDVMLHEIGHDLLGQVRVGRLQERAEVLRVADEVADGLVLLGLVLRRD